MLVYHPHVQKDVSAILRYYDQHSNALGDQFWHELKSVIAAVGANPERYHPANDRLRRANLARFPYHVLFRIIPQGIRVTAVRHNKSHPERALHRH